MTFDEWYENLTADCPTWRTSLARESARVVWAAAVSAERERCAKLCDDMTLYTGFDCAIRIREA